MATQSEINAFVEQIMPFFDPTPVAEDAVEQSWPRLDRGLSDVQDMVRFQHLKGIFGHGGRPYWLRNNGTVAETNATRTMVLTVSTTTGTAEATLHGAFHRLRGDLVLEFPGVSSVTTYYVVIEYDPIRSADGGDPLEVKVLTSLNESQGKDYIRLWDVECRPSQVLTDATITRWRPFAASVITTNNEREFPTPSSILTGTVAFGRHDGTIKTSMMPNEPDEDGNVSSDGRWIDMIDRPWVNLSLNSFYSSQGSATAQIQRVGKKRYLRGAVTRPDGQPLTTAWSEGWHITTVPVRDRPIRDTRVPVSGAGWAPSRLASLEIRANGEMRAYSAGQSMSWVGLHGVWWEAE